MYKRASRRSGGNPLYGWSTQKETEPTDYRVVERQKRAEARRELRTKADVVREYLRSVARSQVRLSALPAVPKSIEHLIALEVRELGILQWAKRQPHWSKILKAQKKYRRRGLKKNEAQRSS